MPIPASRRLRPGKLGPLALALAAALVASLPAAAFNKHWTDPVRVFDAPSAPSHAMTTDAVGAVHIAAEKGSSGIWYVTNKGGSWTSCRVSDGNDRAPSIALDSDVVHVAFARRSSGQEGAYTASGDQVAAGAGCGWTVRKRATGTVKDTALRARGGVLSLLFRTGSRKLRFYKGAASAGSWSIKETVDRRCCTSRPTLELTSGGAPRVAYGDGTWKGEGLKFAKRKAKGWKKTTVVGGRVKHVAMFLDTNPPLFGGRPTNNPTIAFVRKRTGVGVAFRVGSGWGHRLFGKASGPVDITHHSNVTSIAYVRGGDLYHLRSSGGIWAGAKLSGSGVDVKLQYHRGALTFSKKAGNTGVYYTRPT